MRQAQAAVADGAPLAIWLIGLSGAGKSMTARAIADELARRSRTALLLDGDELRGGLNADLGFARADRHEAARRAAHVSALAAAAGIVPLTAMITPYRGSRAAARAVHEAAGVTLFEIWVATPIEVCARRDPKGLYAAARHGRLARMTGVDDPFEAPLAPDLVIDASSTPPSELARIVLGAVLAGTDAALDRRATMVNMTDRTAGHVA